MRWWDRQLNPRDEEVWVELANGRYAISSFGRLMSRTRTKEWQQMNPVVMPSGYLTVGLYAEKGKKPTTHLIHRLVVQTFDGEPSEGRSDVRHLDGQKDNNTLKNLAWGTRSENMQDVISHRSMPREPRERKTKQKWYQGYTTDKHLVQTGCELHAEGVLTIEHLARLWACTNDVARSIVHGKTRMHIARAIDVTKQKRRSPSQKALIRSLVAANKGLREINSELNETLTAQDLYYYKSKPV